jgi:putative phage-type endonuclease
MTHDRDWHEERQGGIGASEMAAIIGLSPWQTPLAVQERKLGAVEEEAPPPLRFWLGLRLEPVIAELTEAKLDVRLRRAPKRYWHPTAPMHCELDYKVTGRPEHVECKVANFGEDWGPDGSQTIPRHYIPQVQAQLAVTGNVRATVACLYHGQELRTYTFERDEGYIADLVELATDWWDRHIVRREPVPPLGDDLDRIRRRHPRSTEEELVSTPELDQLVERLRSARLNVSQATEQEAAIKAALIDAMGSASRLIGPDYTVTYRNAKDTVEVVWEQVAKSYRASLEAAYQAGPLWDVGLGAPDTLDAIESLYTVSKPGSRRFVPTWKEREG